MRLAAISGQITAPALASLLFAVFATAADEAADKPPQAPANPKEAHTPEKPKEVWISQFVSDTECHQELRPGSRISFTHCELKKKPSASADSTEAQNRLDAIRRQQALQEQIGPRTIAERVRQASGLP